MSARLLTAEAAVEAFLPERTPVLAVGGMHMHNNPMALVFELVRQGRRARCLLTSPSAGLNADVLIGAGLAGEVMTSYVGFEHLGLAPRFRHAVESGAVRLREICEGTITHGLQAGAAGLPFTTLPPALELSDVAARNRRDYAYVQDPFGSDRVLAARALRPDVAIVHAAEADEAGTVWFAGAQFTDRLMALAARTLVVQVERLVSAAEMSARPPGTTVPGFLVSAVVVAPGGCRPTASHGHYSYDETELRRYLAAARDEAGFRSWLEGWTRPALVAT